MEKINAKDIISIKAHHPMKVAHFAHVVPHLAGISGTAVDMISAERLVGIDSQLIDYEGSNKPCIVDIEKNNVVTIGPSWAKKADIIVRHSAIPSDIQALNKPQVMCLHGRPEYGFMLHSEKGLQLIDEYIKCAADSKYRRFITFWKEHLSYLNFLMPDSKIEFVPAMVNLDFCKPEGAWLNYDSDGGKPNILIADMWREDTTPFNVLNAVAIFVQKYCPSARLNIYGLQNQHKNPVKEIMEKLKRVNVIGLYDTIIKNMPQIYRGNDILVTPHHIATRVIREALASGVPIVAGQGCPYTKYTADARHWEGFAAKIDECWNDIKGNKEQASKDARMMAEKSFNLKQAGEAALKIYEQIMKEPKPKIEVRTKPMIYNFIVYATDSEGGGKDVGKAYNRYMELLPKDDDWACFIDHDAMFTTEGWFKQLGEIIARNPDYGLLTAVTNRIGNPEQKLAKLKDTHDMLYHREIGRLAQDQKYFEVVDVTKTHCISGVVMAVKKSVWKKAGGFRENGFLGVDNDFHVRVARAGFKIGVMRGFYVYHCYRADNEEGLKPVG